jgi:hypothetical protein
VIAPEAAANDLEVGVPVLVIDATGKLVEAEAKR